MTQNEKLFHKSIVKQVLNIYCRSKSSPFSSDILSETDDGI